MVVGHTGKAMMTEHTLVKIFFSIYAAFVIAVFSIGYVQAKEVEAQYVDAVKDLDMSVLYKFALSRSVYTSPTLANATLLVIFTSQKAIQDAFFAGDKVAVEGYYPYNTNEIYIAFKAGMDEYGRSIIIHEMIHYIQDKNGMPKKTCVDIMAQERQAYKVQNMYLRMYNKSISITITPENTC